MISEFYFIIYNKVCKKFKRRMYQWRFEREIRKKERKKVQLISLILEHDPAYSPLSTELRFNDAHYKVFNANLSNILIPGLTGPSCADYMLFSHADFGVIHIQIVAFWFELNAGLEYIFFQMLLTCKSLNSSLLCWCSFLF